MILSSQIFNLSIIEIINLINIAVVLISFLTLLKLDDLSESPKYYLETLFVIVLLILIIDFLNNRFLDKTYFLYPFSFFFYFLVYPLIYLYTKDLISTNQHQSFRDKWKYFVFPVIIFVVISIIYYPLAFEEKKQFHSFHISQSAEAFSPYYIFQMIVVPAYYLQLIVYLVLISLLVKFINENIHSSEVNLLIGKYSKILVFGIIFFESFIFLTTIVVDNVLDRKIIETVFLSFFIFFGLYIAFNQSIIKIQTRMALLIRKVEDQEEISKIKRLNNYDDENDFSELEELIRRFITATKIYLDPNLTIQNFSKKIHLPSKKVSFIINRCFKGNFHHFINQFRIQEATNIMHNEENVKIEDLYSKVGFNSRSTFNRVFRDFKGVSPSEYIENRKSV